MIAFVDIGAAGGMWWGLLALLLFLAVFVREHRTWQRIQTASADLDAADHPLHEATRL